MLYAQILHINVVLAAFSSYMYEVKAAEMTFVWKILTFNVDEIDTFLFSDYYLKIRQASKSENQLTQR